MRLDHVPQAALQLLQPVDMFLCPGALLVQGGHGVHVGIVEQAAYGVEPQAELAVEHHPLQPVEVRRRVEPVPCGGPRGGLGKTLRVPVVQRPNGHAEALRSLAHCQLVIRHAVHCDLPRSPGR